MRRNTLRFTFLSKEEIEILTENISTTFTLLQNVCEEITVMVHSTEDLENAIKASDILFGNSTSDDLRWTSHS
jgi:tyrosyl-tRNA synthetase